MIFSKEELSFLSIYAKCADTKQAQNDKFQIKASKEKQSVIFSQFSEDAKVITEISKKIDDDFVGIYPIGQFLAIIQSLPNEATIDIQNDGIHFNQNKYEFEKFDFASAFVDTETFVESVKAFKSSVIISDFSKTKNCFIGQEPLDYVLLMNGKFVSAISCDSLICSYTTSNEKDTVFFIPKLAVTLCNEFKIEKVEFKTASISDTDFNFTVINNTTVIFNNKDYDKDMSNLFNDENRSLYDHETKVSIKKNDIKDAMNRIKVFSAKNIYSRIYCSTTNNQFKVESKEQNSGYAIEVVEADINDVLKSQDYLFCISQAYLSTVISYLKGEQIIIHSDIHSPDGVAIKITDEIGDDFFILCFVQD